MKRIGLVVTIMSNIILVFVLAFVGIFCAMPQNISANNIINGCVYAGNTETGKVSLMINVYWGTEYIEPILDVLEQKNAKCTFFVGGSWAEKNKTMLKAIYNRGHEIASHGYSHKEHEKLSLEQNLLEMQKTHEIVKDIIGYEITLFAPPGGSYNKYTTQAAEIMKYACIMWTRDTIDWRDQNTTLIYNRATNNIKSGDLILMHPKAKTLEALPQIIDYVNQKGLKITTVSDTIA